ncbi:MAG: hypothetical protein AUK34_14730 [Ignavibacteria bacterium CG2_30_36_16]|nr:T9SS type A sorting domain-containing protein [Ignavibacteria bacterium]OIP54716.1 MAG: hypothetical protein AUK34_14730 [Ignavibacteria bacterium CG2_30_36_16]PJB00868.1 MAG: hypothetical protein CO127_06695 [Ignavibacteria bacterium CG_4_9_14_3_um_filter_36_18]
MYINIKVFILSMFLQVSINAQYPPAVEKWSTPVRVDSFSARFESEMASSFNNKLDTVYFFRSDAVYFSYLLDSIWSSPKKLNSNINNGQPIRFPTISRDGKRLYFVRWGGYGNWDLWYSEWRTNFHEWGPSINLGSNVNSSSLEFYALEISRDTLYTLNDRWASEGLCTFIKDSVTNNWFIVDSSNYNHPFGAGKIRGLSVTGDRKKAYFSQYILGMPDTLQSELFVTYWDPTLNRWGATYKLNINSTAFQPTGWFGYLGGWDEYPWISPDGKTLYFTSNRDAAREDTTHAPDIYVSHLLIDDNGDTVTAVKNNFMNEKTNNTFELYPNFPNPFNPATRIRFNLPHKEKIKLIVYDVLGKVVKILVDEVKEAGLHEVEFNTVSVSPLANGRIASGIYFVKLQTNSFIKTQKIVLMK